ncbi:MAG TPA: hypothetical protein VK666_10875 [Chryseolinea sp.]|nr:hypothetical protein [Chryseolinea sp.]
MIRPLRTYHFYLWRSFALALPLIAVLAVLYRPVTTPAAARSEDFLVDVTNSGDTLYTIKLTVANPLKFPTCVAYSTSGNNKTLLGLVDHRGQYDFVVKRSQSDFILTDVIHGNEIVRKSLLTK